MELVDAGVSSTEAAYCIELTNTCLATTTKTEHKNRLASVGKQRELCKFHVVRRTSIAPKDPKVLLKVAVFDYHKCIFTAGGP